MLIHCRKAHIRPFYAVLKPTQSLEAKRILSKTLCVCSSGLYFHLGCDTLGNQERRVTWSHVLIMRDCVGRARGPLLKVSFLMKVLKAARRKQKLVDFPPALACRAFCASRCARAASRHVTTRSQAQDGDVSDVLRFIFEDPFCVDSPHTSMAG